MRCVPPYSVHLANSAAPASQALSQHTSSISTSGLEQMEDDFTFPAPGGGRHDDGPAALPATHLGRLQLPGVAAPGAPPLWPFAAPPVGAAATVKEEEAPAPASGRGDAREEEERELERLVAADEERMDLLLEGAAAATAPASRSGGRVGAQLPERRAEAEEEQKARTAAADAERMDLLWESFNEELLLRRAGSKAAADHPDGVARPGLDQGWHFCHSPSDTESEEKSSSERRYGCAPTMLRASSRAGGAGQFCSSPRRRSRGRGTAAAGGWALLLRLFRRLLAVDKTASRPHSIYVP